MSPASVADMRRGRSLGIVPSLRSPVWWVCCLAFTSLGLSQAGIKYTEAGGTLAPAVFLFLWLMLVAAYPGRAINLMVASRLTYALPLLALVSSLWSVDPGHTERLASEFLLAIAVAVFAAGCTPPAMMVSANMVAMLLQVVFSLASGVQQDIVYAGNEALSGLFGSKNFMGYIGALLSLLSIATLADAKQPRVLRALGAAGLVLGLVALLRARSADAIFGLGAGMAVMAYILAFGWLPRQIRALVNGGTALAGIGLGVIAFVWGGQLYGMLLNAAGKDSSLTGRTYLWQHATELITLRPLLGVGYQAFWVQGNPDAEGLWRHFKIEERGGFSFHNMYYQISVDLGAVGAIVWFTVFAIVLLATLAAALRRPGPTTAFFLAYLIFIGIRQFVEVELLGPFDLGPILLTCAWVYATARPRPAGAVSRTTPVGVQR